MEISLETYIWMLKIIYLCIFFIITIAAAGFASAVIQWAKHHNEYIRSTCICGHPYNEHSYGACKHGHHSNKNPCDCVRFVRKR